MIGAIATAASAHRLQRSPRASERADATYLRSKRESLEPPSEADATHQIALARLQLTPGEFE